MVAICDGVSVTRALLLVYLTSPCLNDAVGTVRVIWVFSAVR